MLSCRDDGAAGVDHVVDQDADLVFDLAHDIFCNDGVLLSGNASLVHDGKRCPELVGISLGHFHTACVWRHDDEIIVVQHFQIVDEHRHCRQVVDWTIKEALDLSRMQVDTYEPIRTGSRKHVGDELRGDGLTSCGLSVLAPVSIERCNHRYPLRRSSIRSVNHDEVLNERVVYRAVGPR